MILSMTGFAATSAELPGTSLVAELRSVNHRYLDLSIRLPDELRSLYALRQGQPLRLERRLQRQHVCRLRGHERLQHVRDGLEAGPLDGVAREQAGAQVAQSGRAIGHQLA